MASTYTVNLGIEKIATGEQSGTWGTTTNTNFDLIDQAVNGIVQVTLPAAGSSGSPKALTITDGTASDGRNKYIEFVDGGDLGATAYVQLQPNDAEKIVHIRNSLSGGRSVIIFQGTYNASNDFEVPNGKDVVLKFDGAGASATVTQVFEDLLVTAVAATTVDTTNIEVTNLKAKDGTSAGSIADSTGVVTIASSVLTTTDINGGSVDGVTLGTNSAVTEAQIDNININGNTISSTDTNGNVTITPDGTGSVAITKIDVAGGEIDGTTIGANSASTGAFTTLNATGGGALTGTWTDLGSVTTVDINGGTIDGVTIGGASAAAGSFTTITASDDVNFDSGTFFVDASANAVGIGTTSPDSLLHIVTSAFGGLHIESTGATSDPILKLSNDNGGASNWQMQLDKDAGSLLQFRYNNTAQVSINTSGNVGIGTTSPSSFNQVGADTLVVGSGSGEQGITIYSGTANNGVVAFADGTTTTEQYKGYIGYNHSSNYMRFFTDASERMRIDSSGRLGIGTTGPESRLTVLQPALDGNAILLPMAASAVAENYSSIRGKFAVGNDFCQSEVRFGVENTGSGTGFLAFSTGTNSNTERMRITSAGLVGIGTSSPSNKLQIALSGAGTPYAAFNSTSDNPFLEMQRWTGTGSDYRGTRIKNESAAIVFENTIGAAIGSQTFTERMRIDSSGNVGIGATPAFYQGSGLEIERAGIATVRLQNTTSGKSAELKIDTDLTLETINTGSAILFNTGATERARIDSSGNVNVGCTDGNSLYNNSGTNTGAGVLANGQIQQAVYQDVVHYANRTGNDGTITSFQKDGTTVGSIGVASSDMYIGTGVANLRFFDSLPSLVPATSAGASSDAAIDLGWSSGRFKDLYLSGGVYLGGTGAANLLDDYEEGTWTPNIYGAATGGTYTYSNGFATYTKVGRKVTIGMYMTAITESSAGSGYLVIGGLPFAKMANSQFTGAVRTEQIDLGTSNTSAVVEFTVAVSAVSTLYIRGMQNNASGSDVQISDITSGSSIIGFSLTYFTA